MYLCLAGSLPFDDESSDKEIARQTIYENPPFPNNVWNKISKDAKDLVMKLLEKNPDNRIKITELLSHPWLSKRTSPSPQKHKKNLSISKNSIKAVSNDKNLEILKSFVESEDIYLA